MRLAHPSDQSIESQYRSAKRKLTRILLATFSIISMLGLGTANAQFGGIGQETNMVEDIVFSDDTGIISVQIPYLNGEEQQRRIRFTADSGDTVEILIFPDFPSGPSPVTIITPDGTFTIAELSSTSVRVRNLGTNQSWTLTESSPPSLSGFFGLNLPNPTTTWGQEIMDLAIAYQAFIGPGTIAPSHPLKWIVHST